MNLKPGMLCLIIGSKHAPENIGKQVTLVRYFGKDESIVTQDGEFNNLTGSDVWLVEGADLVCTMRDEIGAICYMKKLDSMYFKPPHAFNWIRR